MSRPPYGVAAADARRAARLERIAVEFMSAAIANPNRGTVKGDTFRFEMAEEAIERAKVMILALRNEARRCNRDQPEGRGG